MNTQEAKALLPWYAAGALDVNEAREVEAALREDPSLERELKEFRALHASVQSVADDEPAFRPALLDEAHRRIDAYQRTHKSTPDKNFFAAVNASLGSTLEKLFGVWTGMPTYARVAVAGQFAVIAVLGVLLAIRTPEKVFDTAKGPNEGTNAHAVITVAFQPNASAMQIDDLLTSVNAQIVSGPSAQQNYALTLADNDGKHVEEVLTALRAQSSIVRFAAPIE